MRVHNYEIEKKMKMSREWFVLNYFLEDDKWGIGAIFVEGELDCISVYKVYAVGSSLNWEHYANIQRTYRDGLLFWELNTQFNGEGENEMWIYGYYKRFSDIVRAIAKESFKGKKPMVKYK